MNADVDANDLGWVPEPFRTPQWVKVAGASVGPFAIMTAYLASFLPIREIRHAVPPPLDIWTWMIAVLVGASSFAAAFRGDARWEIKFFLMLCYLSTMMAALAGFAVWLATTMFPPQFFLEKDGPFFN